MPEQQPEPVSPHLAAAYVAKLQAFLEVAKKSGAVEIEQFSAAWLARGPRAIGESEIDAALFADHCRCPTERDRMFAAFAKVIDAEFEAARAG